MKLLRYGPLGQEKPGVLDAEGCIRDLSAHSADLKGEAVSLAALDALRRVNIETLPIVSGKPRIGSCLADAP
ncbi:MAG: 2-hydroxyhepta-2,4-diene-1,7-dioate isomerase, partial [Rhodobacterales bacterium CG18_big_fil_WC_8_21_14_2_50_71_9]